MVNHRLRKAIKYLVISDVHLGHQTNPTVSILNNLTLYFEGFSPTSRFRDLDIIFIAGDLWDRLLELSASGVFEFVVWWDRLMRFCKKNKIKIRLLEGTKSHDRGQSKLAEIMANIYMDDLDFKYVSTLSIEHMDDLGLDVLYVPDEWSPSGEETLSQVEDLLKDKHLQQVDIAIMHGMFGWQLKNIPGNHPKHDEHRYLEIVRYFINIGHVHTFSVYQRAIAQGSFDRLKHNEEEPKGGTVCYLNPNGENRFEFVENKHAMIFKTLEIKHKDLDKALRYISKEIAKLPNGSHVRIKASKTHPVYHALKEIQLQHLNVNLTRKSIEDEDEDFQLVKATYVEDETTFTPLNITKDNVVELVLRELQDDDKLNVTQTLLLKQLLEQNC